MPYIGAGISRFTTADALTVSGNATVSGNIDVDGTTDLDGLTVAGTTNLDGAVVVNESSADADFRVESNGNANMLFVDGGNDRVGIGTNSPQQLLSLKANNPGGKIRLEMGQTGVASDDVTGEIQFFHNDSSGAGVNADIKGICTSSVGAGALTFGTGTTSTTERMRIHNGGAVSIGTTSAPSKFTVSNAGTDNIIEAANTSNSVRGGMQADTSVVGIGAITNHSVDFRTNATARMRLHLGGDLSLGTTTQAGRFNIENADNGESVVRIKNTSTSYNNDMLQLMCSRDGATSEYNAMTVFDNNTDLKMLIRPDGDLENVNKNEY